MGLNIENYQYRVISRSENIISLGDNHKLRSLEGLLFKVSKKEINEEKVKKTFKVVFYDKESQTEVELPRDLSIEMNKVFLGKTSLEEAIIKCIDRIAEDTLSLSNVKEHIVMNSIFSIKLSKALPVCMERVSPGFIEFSLYSYKYKVYFDDKEQDFIIIVG